MDLRDLQERIRELFGEKDSRRGLEGTFMWFMEEIGELSSALRSGNSSEIELEFADVLAWLVTLANCAEIDLHQAFDKKYGSGCPGCGFSPCRCTTATKP